MAESTNWRNKDAFALPEDDGMTQLRQRILAIQQDTIPSAQKARKIHEVMTERYRYSAQDRATSADVAPETESHGSYCYGHPFYLKERDMEPSYVPPEELPCDDFEDSHATADGLVEEKGLSFGCKHYKRNIKVQCHACRRWYTCRFCHDEQEAHSMERKDIEYMMCMLCSSPQKASQWCQACGSQTAQYYCSICKLWDNDGSKSIYHCHGCGICRLGQGLGKDYFHCKTCCVCLPLSIQATHRCIERSTQCDCPICGEYMFTSPKTVIFMRCGHSIHQECFSDYTMTSYRCPICSKTVTNMDAHFRNLDRSIESQPMPPELRNEKAIVHCNDCRAKTIIKYHWLGLKCDICDSYNTVQLRLLSNQRETEEASGPGSFATLNTRLGQSLPGAAEDAIETSPRLLQRELLAGENELVEESRSTIQASPISPREYPFVSRELSGLSLSEDEDNSRGSSSHERQGEDHTDETRRLIHSLRSLAFPVEPEATEPCDGDVDESRSTHVDSETDESTGESDDEESSGEDEDINILGHR